ncbi:MAG: CHAT domain-containing protein, partial [Cyclobacteriaceae bacterium]|nr:CHAT domain-containing protein [Cyclobacteriaceae bacterium]
AKKRYQKFFSTSHPEYVKVQSKLSKTYYMSGDWRHAQIQMEEVLSNYKHFIETYFPALSEREKTKFWNTIKTDYEFYVSLIISNNRNEKYIGELYNNALLTKALLLNASIKIRHRIMGSQDEELIENYMKWVDKKELLTTALSMTNDQLVQSGINTGQLSNELEQLEKELSLSSELFGQEYEKKPITWEDIQKNLQENEYAMEMVRFRVFNHTFTDSIKYALLYVSGEKRSKPQLILLENGKDLEAKYLNFYRNTIKYKIKDTQSYAAFWEPISRAIGSVSTLYLSPDGVYNQINLEAIPLPEDGKYVIDNSNIILLSNTRELLVTARKMTEAASQQMALMFGNPLFYIETTPGIASPGSGHTRETTQVISQLPGTKKEIEEVKDLLSRKGWDINEYTDLEANEEAIKNVFNPKIFHVATHGFFQNERIEANAMDTELHENYLYENPLMKSGLLLAGAGDILNETRFNYNVNNGILTAYEAMNLNLDQTDLVVLSACETGLGEVESGEGVYGLQRAFMVAGAKTIIMSLFKVSDEATQQLMIKFYRKWIETGNKRLAFSEAKKEIRIEYRDPIYWGPFIMIGLE